MNSKIDIRDYTYELPHDRIAIHPLLQRDQSKLLVYQNDQITHQHFFQLPDLLPAASSLFFNNTKVIPARLIFKKETGAAIEIFLLQPGASDELLQHAMQSTGSSLWKCAIGNLKRWPDGTTLTSHVGKIVLEATLLDRAESLVELKWQPSDLTFADVVHEFGMTPLPPYLNREAIEEDKERYQTIYSQWDGAVAAPTAGLHFTENVMTNIRAKGILTDFLTLHVSAGTFQPVKTDNAVEHNMHSEQIIITQANIDNLLLPDRKIIAVGTTSARTLESVYWYGVKLLTAGESDFVIDKLTPYQYQENQLPSLKQALLAVKDKVSSGVLKGSTSIYILPGYKFRIINGLITNFHQPGSTLMLLVAALVGERWHKIYDEALAKQYRFLSYGDSSLLMNK